MNNLKVLIIEDQDAEASFLKDTLLQMGYKVPAIAKTLSEGLEYFALHEPDISLIDIYLNGKPDGIVFGIQINEKISKRKPFLFLTNAMDSSTFKLAKSSMPYQYLLKPFNKPELQYAIELATDRYKNDVARPIENASAVPRPLFVKRGNTLVKCQYDDIKYIEVEGKYSKIVCQNEKFLVQLPLKDFYNQLPPDQFFRIHRNYIINVKEVTKIDAQSNEVFFKDGKILSFSRRFIDEFLHIFRPLK